MAPQEQASPTNPGQAEQAVLDALRQLEATLREVLGPEVLFVLVTAHPCADSFNVWRSSNCDRVSCELLQLAIDLRDESGGHFSATLRQ